jgi:hypothetical protein
MSANTTPLPVTAISPDEHRGPLFEDGDCAIILKANGGYKIVTTGIDEQALADPEKLADPSKYTEEETALLERGQKLMALALALSNDQVMAILLDLSSNPEIVDPKKLAHGKPH